MKKLTIILALVMSTFQTVSAMDLTNIPQSRNVEDRRTPVTSAASNAAVAAVAVAAVVVKVANPKP